jgi:hypothetical protein
VNLWNAGGAAFMGNWASAYALLSEQPGNDREHFSVAPLPTGPGGRWGARGGMGGRQRQAEKGLGSKPNRGFVIGGNRAGQSLT